MTQDEGEFFDELFAPEVLVPRGADGKPTTSPVAVFTSPALNSTEMDCREPKEVEQARVPVPFISRDGELENAEKFEPFFPDGATADEAKFFKRNFNNAVAEKHRDRIDAARYAPPPADYTPRSLTGKVREAHKSQMRKPPS